MMSESKNKSEKTKEDIHKEHRKRLRARYEKEGLSAFTPHEALELSLFYALPRKNTNDIAHELIDTFGSFSEVLEASVHDLEGVKGIGHEAAIFLSLLKDIHIYYQNEKINSKKISGHDEIVEYIFTRLSGLTEEHVMLVCVDNKMNMICADMICKGSVNSAALSTRAVINSALKHNAVAVILAHNHPRGYSLPSREDLQTTQVIRDALKTISVALVDHVICSATDKTSLASCEQLEYLFR